MASMDSSKFSRQTNWKQSKIVFFQSFSAIEKHRVLAVANGWLLLTVLLEEITPRMNRYADWLAVFVLKRPYLCLTCTVLFLFFYFCTILYGIMYGISAVQLQSQHSRAGIPDARSPPDLKSLQNWGFV
jgi:hypothetical protein